MQLAEVNNGYNKDNSTRDATSLWHMCASITALGPWSQLDNRGAYMKTIGVNDGERANELIHLIGIALLATLDAVDRMGWLNSDSEILDLGLIMSPYQD